MVLLTECFEKISADDKKNMQKFAQHANGKIAKNSNKVENDFCCKF